MYNKYTEIQHMPNLWQYTPSAIKTHKNIIHVWSREVGEVQRARKCPLVCTFLHFSAKTGRCILGCVRLFVIISNGVVCDSLIPVQAHNAIILLGLPGIIFKTSIHGCDSGALKCFTFMNFFSIYRVQRYR